LRIDEFVSKLQELQSIILIFSRGCEKKKKKKIPKNDIKKKNHITSLKSSILNKIE